MGPFDRPPRAETEESPLSEPVHEEAIMASSRIEDATVDPERELELIKRSLFASILLAPEEQNLMKRRAIVSQFRQMVDQRLQKEGIDRDHEMTAVRNELSAMQQIADRTIDTLHSQAPKGELSYRTGGIPRSSARGRMYATWKILLERTGELLRSL